MCNVCFLIKYDNVKFSFLPLGPLENTLINFRFEFYTIVRYFNDELSLQSWLFSRPYEVIFIFLNLKKNDDLMSKRIMFLKHLLRWGYTWIGVKLEVIFKGILKWVGNTTRQFTPKREPQVGRGLFGVHLLIPHFKFQLSKSIKSSTFHIFLYSNVFFERKYLFLKMFTQNCQTVVNAISREI